MKTAKRLFLIVGIGLCVACKPKAPGNPSPNTVKEPTPASSAADLLPADMELGDAVSAWFRGEIPTEVFRGKKYKTFGVPSKLWQIEPDYLIYNVGDDYGREFKVAMPRDFEYEKEAAKDFGGSVKEFYDFTQKGEFDSSDPIHHAEYVKIDRIGQFHDERGAVVVIPVVLPSK